MENSKKVFVVSSTPRKDGNSDVLCDAFIKGAAEAGHTVDRVNLRDIDLKFCIGCFACQKSKEHLCVLKDGVNELLPKMQEADVLVFATPVYFYDMAGQLKTFIDRLNALFPRKNKFTDIYLLAAAADTANTAMDGTIKGVTGFVECFEGTNLKAVVSALGVTGIGDVTKTAYMDEAYNLGKGI